MLEDGDTRHFDRQGRAFSIAMGKKDILRGMIFVEVSGVT